MRVSLVLLALVVGLSFRLDLTQLGAASTPQALRSEQPTIVSPTKLNFNAADSGFSQGLVSVAFETPYYLLNSSQKANIDAGTSSYVTLLASKVSGDATAYTAHYSTDSKTYTKGNTLDFVPVADIPSPVVNKAESADVYLANEVDFPKVITNQLGIVVWRKEYQLVRVNRYDPDTHAVNLTLGVAGTAIKGFNFNDDNTAKLYLIDASHLVANTMLTNGDTMHVKSVPEVNSVGDIDNVDALQITSSQAAQRPFPVGNITFNGGHFPGEMSYYIDLDWQMRSKTSGILAFSDDANVVDAGVTTRIRFYNDADVLVHTQNVASGTSYSYNRSKFDGNDQALTFVFTSVINSGQANELESEPVTHRLLRTVTDLYTNALTNVSGDIGPNGTMSISMHVDRQDGTTYTKAIALSGSAANSIDWTNTYLVATDLNGVELTKLDDDGGTVSAASLIFEGRDLPFEVKIPDATYTLTFNFGLSGATVGDTLIFETPVNSGDKSVTANII